MIVLDSDLLSIFQRAEGVVFARLQARLLSSSDQDIRVTTVSMDEQLRGWLAYIAKARSEEGVVEALVRLRTLVERFRERLILDYDRAAANEFNRLRRERVRIGAMDLRIASTVLVNNALLLSKNLKDFRKVPGLRVEDWTADPEPPSLPPA